MNHTEIPVGNDPQEPTRELDYSSLTDLARELAKAVARQWLDENEEATLDGREERDMATADCMEALKTINEWCVSIYGICAIEREIYNGLRN